MAGAVLSVAPITSGFAVVKGTTYKTTRALYVGFGGTLIVNLLDGSQITMNNVNSGTWFPISFVSVDPSSTTDLMVGLL